MTVKPCPICKQPAPANPASPFCSSRCRLLDLGNWLDDRYVIPGQPSDDAQGVPTANGDEDDH